eukprot:scaffold24142_cov36-Phaeocystis_antarctica.AAC.1
MTSSAQDDPTQSSEYKSERWSRQSPTRHVCAAAVPTGQGPGGKAGQGNGRAGRRAWLKPR